MGWQGTNSRKDPTLSCASILPHFGRVPLHESISPSLCMDFTPYSCRCGTFKGQTQRQDIPKSSYLITTVRSCSLQIAPDPAPSHTINPKPFPIINHERKHLLINSTPHLFLMRPPPYHPHSYFPAPFLPPSILCPLLSNQTTVSTVRLELLPPTATSSCVSFVPRHRSS